MTEDSPDSPTPEKSRYTDPDLAVDHVRRIAREAAAQSGYRAAAFAVMQLRQEYRIMPLKQNEAPPDRLATWQAVRMETRSLVPMAMGAHGGVKADAAFFDERVATPSDQPLPQQPGWAPVPSVALQAAALHSHAPASPSRPPVGPQSPGVDQTPAR
ncbi:MULTISPECIES: hypothetical protein [unclassified Nocardioides]|uniref:hypothetical protein n=1 Tax=unclassified Nocardioides TaxID=2615069 RepID=UPI0000571544|nr:MULTISPECIES: hypothetical protein [unclassified Nocardioides]ABL79328.1 hypothetical protein Noca_4742 [Nocardioides sp. JS614]